MLKIKSTFSRSLAMVIVVASSTGCAPMTKMVNTAEGGHSLRAARIVNDELQVEVPGLMRFR